MGITSRMIFSFSGYRVVYGRPGIPFYEKRPPHKAMYSSLLAFEK